MGIVMQENFFKNETLASNIALGKKIDKNKIKDSLIKANAWDFVRLLPNGIDEMILDRGLRFSGGERQRIALARALYNDPQVLISKLAEIKSSVSALAEIKSSVIGFDWNFCGHN